MSTTSKTKEETSPDFGTSTLESASKRGKLESSGAADGGIPLCDASKMGFNERAWNDPPPLLISTNKVNPGAPRPKLTARVAFPLNSTKIQEQGTSLNPAGPPPVSGFVHKIDDLPPPPSADNKSKPPSTVPPPTSTS